MDDIKEDSVTVTDVNEFEDTYQNLAQQISFLQLEKEKTEEEFGIQRAKMKDLFLQKENKFKQQLVDQEKQLNAEIKKLQNELNDCRSQMTVLSLEVQSKLEGETRKYREELSSLQHLLKETVEENMKYENENKHLNYLNSKLVTELNELKNNNSSNGSGADIPPILSVPGTVISSLARKVTNQITTQLGSSDNISNNSIAFFSQQAQEVGTLDDSMRKVNRYAQEDATVLRSLVIPLEEEIKALKDKLREMDCELRKYQDGDKNTHENQNIIVQKIIDVDDDPEKTSEVKMNSIEHTNIAFSTCFESMPPTSIGLNASVSCEMCSNYESQLLNAQEKIHDLEKHIISLERYKQELSKETAFRKDMEEKWNEKKEEYKEEVSVLHLKTLKAEETLKELKSTFTSTYDDVTLQLRELHADRENSQKELNRLQKENNILIGKYSKHSQQLQNEVISLPNNVEDLHELVLRCQEELIAAKIAKELADETVKTLTEESTFLRQQLQSVEQMRIELENKLLECMNKLKHDVHQISQERNQHIEAYQGVDRDNASLREEMKQYATKLEKLYMAKKQCEETVNELRSRVSSLQTELDNSEKVQKDFVLLSQSLQQELEKIRGAETEVRWEHEDDVVECRRCKINFSVTKRKMHCRHCGRIFCTSCLIRTVNSGPNNRPSKVCDVCHTLLVRDSAPYFSTVPPQGD